MQTIGCKESIKYLANHFIVALVFSFVLPITGRAQEWREAAPLPLALQEIYADTLDGQIYTGGGIPSDAGFTDQFSRFDPIKNRWTVLKPIPQRRHHITITAVKDRIFALGGFLGRFPNWQAQSSVYIYDPAGNSWTIGVDLPTARGEHISAFVDGKIFVVGGRVRSTPDANRFDTHKDTKLNEVFDLETGEWSKGAPALTARNSAASAVIDGKIYVVGGRQNRLTEQGNMKIENVANLEVYDPERDQWEQRVPMPVAQGGLAAAAHNGKLYVFGGEEWFPQVRVIANAWVYDPASDIWTPLPDMPTPRHGLAACAVGAAIFVIGGATVPGFGAVNTNEVLRVTRRE